MKLSTVGVPSVSVDEIRNRLIVFRDSEDSPLRLYRPSHLAAIMWPGHRMLPQGAGLAATGVLRKLGLSWQFSNGSSGYRLHTLREKESR